MGEVIVVAVALVVKALYPVTKTVIVPMMLQEKARVVVLEDCLVLEELDFHPADLEEGIPSVGTPWPRHLRSRLEGRVSFFSFSDQVFDLFCQKYPRRKVLQTRVPVV